MTNYARRAVVSRRSARSQLTREPGDGGQRLFKHANSFTATCALPVHNVAAEGTRYDPTCKAHTHMADDRRAGDRHIAGDYRDRHRDRDCSLATNMSRIGSDSYQYYPNWYIQTSGFPNGSVFITSQHRSCPVCALRRENALAQSSPLYRSQGHVSRRSAQARIA